jgi:hypothetical protein
MQAAEREMLYRFFALPAAAAHESWLTFMPAEIVSLSRRSQLGTLLLSRMLMRRAALPAPQSFDLAEEHRWVLHSPISLAQAAMKLGAVALGPQVAASIERERVLLLRSALGPDLYRESVSAASTPFAVIAREPLMECTTTDAIRALIERVGMTLMLATLPQDEALRRRVITKFPQAYADPQIPVSSVDTQAVSTRLRSLLQGD